MILNDKRKEIMEEQYTAGKSGEEKREQRDTKDVDKKEKNRVERESIK